MRQHFSTLHLLSFYVPPFALTDKGHRASRNFWGWQNCSLSRVLITQAMSLSAVYDCENVWNHWVSPTQH